MSDLKMPMSPRVKKTSFKGSPQYNLSVMNYLKNKSSSIFPNSLRSFMTISQSTENRGKV